MNDQEIIGFIKSIQEKYEIKAAMVTGSYVTGNMRKHSDIDLFCVTQNEEKSIRGRIFHNDIEYEYFLSPEWKYYKRIEEDLTSVRIYSSGKLLMDDNDILKSIIAYAKTKKENYSPELNSTKKRDYSFFIESIYTDGLDMLEDKEYYNFNAFAGIQIEKMCTILCLIRKALPIYPKYFFEELECIDNKFCRHIKDLFYLNCTDNKRIVVWEKICKYMLNELGNEDIKSYESFENIQKN